MGQNESHDASAIVAGVKVKVHEPIQGESKTYFTSNQDLLSELGGAHVLKKKKVWKKTRFREVSSLFLKQNIQNNKTQGWAPFNYKMDNPILIVSKCMGKSRSTKRVNWYFELRGFELSGLRL